MLGGVAGSGFTVSVAFLGTPPKLAEIVTGIAAVTWLVVMGNTAKPAPPAGTLIVAGVDADRELLERVTVAGASSGVGVSDT